MIFFKILLSSLMLIATAEVANASFPVQSQQQKSFAQHIKNSQFKKALTIFESSFSDSYKNSSDGTALHSLLLFKSGVELNGLRNLLSIKRPSAISSSTQSLWRTHLKLNHPIWKVVNKKISNKWSLVFPYIGNYNGYLFSHYSAKSLKQIKKLEKLQINSAIMIDWHYFQLGLANAIHNKTQSALNYFKKISKNSLIVDRSQIALAKARVHYQMKDFKEAIRNYKKVSKKSDLWATALEEQAYTYTVMGKPGMGLAKLKSLFTPVLAPFAGPEPYMLTAFNQEQNCDYISSLKTVSEYKKNFLPRAQSLQKISKKQNTKAVSLLLNNHKLNKLHWKNVSQEITHLPHLIYNDKYLVKFFDGRKALYSELPLMRQLNVAPHIINKATNYANKRIPHLDQQILQRLAYLAKKDLKVISNITKKMHLIEAEVIQQLHIEKPIKAASRFNKPNSREVMVFPDDGEVWLDEIDKYNASIGFCNKKQGKAL